MKGVLVDGVWCAWESVWCASWESVWCASWESVWCMHALEQWYSAFTCWTANLFRLCLVTYCDFN